MLTGRRFRLRESQTVTNVKGLLGQSATDNDAHKKFSVFVAVNEKGQTGEALRVAHDRELYREFLARLPAHSAIAVEASGSY